MDEALSPEASGRRRRMTAEEVEARMLAAGREIVLEVGMTVSLDDVSLEDVMRRAKVPRSSVYRRWPYRGDFIDDLLCYLARPEWVGVSPGQERSLAAARDVVRANQDRLHTPAGRQAVAREAARQATAANLADLLEVTGWTFYFALASTIDYVRDPGARARIAAALEECERVRVDSLAEFYRQLAAILGLRLRAGYRFEHLALAGGALMQGLMVRMVVARNSPHDQTQLTANGKLSPHAMISNAVPGPGLDEAAVDWPFVASAFLGVFDAILELDPDFTPLAELPAAWR